MTFCNHVDGQHNTPALPFSASLNNNVMNGAWGCVWVVRAYPYRGKRIGLVIQFPFPCLAFPFKLQLQSKT